ncbi:nucleolar protein dao-5-like isoform X2 [Sitophilus oryzae]|uniref:Nucleolar protein dao-5-like isoform X2 n=1 Tax=Sitophilus oryzae TaxID=7048 RepID=A0A6J2XSS3_SITOR|nr:nucleolar protein dao-5-like isoform X2 [Sitophilus oryzae]
MEYEKHIERLILGYLKENCKHAYKVFLKYNFQSSKKHVATRVGGQTLLDILKIYSRVQEIIQERLEDTNYYKDKSPEYSSPLYLVDQLVYLLENQRCLSPSSTPCPRSPESSIAESCFQEHRATQNHITDTETTPEHTLPGNIQTSVDKYNFHTLQRRSKTPVDKTCQTKVTSDKNSEFRNENQNHQEKLQSPTNLSSTKNIEYPKPPEVVTTKQQDNNINFSIDESKNTISNTSANDSILDAFFGTSLVNNIDKSQDVNKTSTVCDTSQNKSWNSNEHREVNVSTSNGGGGITSTTVTSNNTNLYPMPVSNVTTHCVVNNSPNNWYMVTQPQAELQNLPQQQFYVVNQPVVIPQNTSLIQLAQKPASSSKSAVKAYKEQDIMAMPTIILNEQNEITFGDPFGLTTNTPLKSNEACNIKEYLTLYSATDQSPVLKFSQKNTRSIAPTKNIQPRPTVKVEICTRDLIDIQKLNKEDSVNVASNDSGKKLTGLPNLNESLPDKPLTEVRNNNLSQAEKCKDINICTPSPLVNPLKKPTPKSGSHVRNLTFPSPLRTTPSEISKDVAVNSPSTINKQQATKDLFKENKKVEVEKTDPKKKTKETTKKNLKTPKKATERKTTKTPKSFKPNPSPIWDSNLRKMAAVAPESTDLTPVKRRTRKSSNELKESDIADGKKLEDALKTPNSKRKGRRRSSIKDEQAEKSLDRKNPVEEVENEKTDSKSDPKVLSPSKLNANKRTILSTSTEADITPDNLKQPAQHPVSAKRRKNINSLLETPLKDVAVPITPGLTPAPNTDTPFTPMLKANLKDFATSENMFTIDTPNFPITPGFSIVSHTDDYYIPKANETDKATEAIVTLEEKKSSVRSTDNEIDDFDEDTAVKVYGTRETLRNFNRSQVGKKNLELLDREEVTWDVNSDKECKSDDSESSSEEDEQNHTVVQAKETNRSKKVVSPVLSVRKRASGKRMDVLKTQLLPEENTKLENSQNLSVASQVLDEDTMEVSPDLTNKISSSLQSTQKGLNESHNSIKDGKDSENKHQNRDINVMKTPENEIDQRTEVIRNTLNCAEIKSFTNIKSGEYSMKKQLEETKKRMIEQEKYSLRKPPKRSCKTRNEVKTPKSRRKTEHPKKIIKRSRAEKAAHLEKSGDADAEDHNARQNKSGKNGESDDSQDEFFKRSGTNLHRKTRGSDEKKPDENKDSVEVEPTDEISIASENMRDSEMKSQSVSKEEEKDKKDSADIAPSTKNKQESLPERMESDDSDMDFDTCYYYSEDPIIIHNETTPSAKKFEDYDLKNLLKQRIVAVPCEGGTDRYVTTSVTAFQSLLDIKSSLVSDEEALKMSDNMSDSENTEDRSDDVDGRNLRKRKRRSDSCGSNSGKKPNVQLLLNPNNIENLLTKLHGPSS